jgi:hypothetical protein
MLNKIKYQYKNIKEKLYKMQQYSTIKHAGKNN